MAEAQHRNYDVAIVGGGVMGSSIAYWLAANPDFDGSIAVIEKDPSYEFSTTARSNSSIRMQFSTALNIKMSQFGIRFIKSIGDYLAVDGEVPDISFVERGYLFLAENAAERQVLLRNHAIQRANGVTEVAVLEPAELGARFPWMNVEGVTVATFGLRNEGWFDPYALMQAFKRKARSLGVEYVHGEVAGLDHERRRVRALRLADGRSISAGSVVNAAGAWAGQVAAMAGIDLPVVPRRRFVFVFSCHTRIDDMPLLIDQRGFYLRPAGRFYLCGMKPSPEEDPDCHSFDVDYGWFEERLWPLLARWVPAFEAVKMERAWAGHYEYNTFDRNALLGPHPDMVNLFFANGFSGHGMQQSAAVGRGISELIVHGRYQTLDLTAFAVDRLLNGNAVVEQYVV